MKALILFVGWCILFVLCWPVALLALILLAIVWLLSLPFRLIGVTLNALFALVRAVLFLPARLIGYRRSWECGVIAFPAISTGIFGFPIQPAAEIAISTARTFTASPTSLREIIFCCCSSSDYQLYAGLLSHHRSAQRVAPLPP